MPKKLNKDEGEPITVRMTRAQVDLLDAVTRYGLYGSTRPDVIRHFLIRELERVLTSNPSLTAQKGKD